MSGNGENRSWTSSLLGGIASAGVPVAACPACWPAYVGLAGSAGFGFLTRGPAALPFASVLLAVALFPLAHRARMQRDYGPLMVGLLGAAVVAVGRLVLGSDSVMLAGGGLLMMASVWNAWPRRTRSCAACVTSAEAIQLE